MEWVIFALIGPLFWTVSNFLDKYAVEKVTTGVADYAFWGGIGAIFVVTLIPVFFDINIPETWLLILIMSAGFLLSYVFMLYGHIVSHTDVSRVVPIFQLRTIMVFVAGALFFGEVMNAGQTLGLFVAIAGTLVLSLDFAQMKKPKLNRWTLYAVVGTAGFAIIILINDLAVENLDIPSIMFIFDIGYLLAAASYLLRKSWRKEIFEGIRTATWRKAGLFAINDISDELGQLFSKLAFVGAPAAALVPAVQGIQAFYAVIAGLAITVWFPHITKEDISKRMLLQKCAGAAIIIVGIMLVQLS